MRAPQNLVVVGFINLKDCGIKQTRDWALAEEADRMREQQWRQEQARKRLLQGKTKPLLMVKAGR